MYTLSPTFVEICLKMTNLYRFNHEDPILQFYVGQAYIA